jgi:hypothetical protein
VSSSIIQLGALGVRDVHECVNAERLEEVVVERSSGDLVPRDSTSRRVREDVLEERGMEHGGSPEVLGEAGAREHGASGVLEGPSHSLGDAVALGRIWRGELLADAVGLAESVHGLAVELAAAIRVEDLDVEVRKSSCLLQEKAEAGGDVALVVHEVRAHKAGAVVSERDAVPAASPRCREGTDDVGVDEVPHWMVAWTRLGGDGDLGGLGALACDAEVTIWALNVGVDCPDDVVPGVAEALVGKLPR